MHKILFVIEVIACIGFALTMPEQEKPKPAVQPVAMVDGHPAKPKWEFGIDQLVKNRGAKDGRGLNVNACVQALANQQGIKGLEGFFEWSAQFEGGSYASKLDSQLKLYVAKNAPGSPNAAPSPLPRYVNDPDCTMADVERLVKRGPLMVTDYGGPNSRYKVPAAAVVILCYLDADWACVIDPNWIGAGERYEWVKRKDFEERCKAQSAFGVPSSMWLFAFTD